MNYSYLNLDLMCNITDHLFFLLLPEFNTTLKEAYNFVMHKSIVKFVVKYNTFIITSVLEEICSNIIKSMDEFNLNTIDDFFNNYSSILNFRFIDNSNLVVTKEFALKWRNFIPMMDWLDFSNITDSFIEQYQLELNILVLIPWARKGNLIKHEYYDMFLNHYKL